MKIMLFCEDRGIGYCGLACVVCSYENCNGCTEKIKNGDECVIGRCAIEKGVDGCYACPDYPCDADMFKNKRIKAFNRYSQEFGKNALIERLKTNSKNGIAYHKPNDTPGDYDIWETEEEIYQFLRYGRNNPYYKCPEFETEHFYIRQVRVQDACDLLECYSDLSSWVFYNNDFSKKIFATQFPTADEIKALINAWLDEYDGSVYVRFSIIDKASCKVIGTIELCDKIGGDKTQAEVVRRGAALHIDLALDYETQRCISEILSLADSNFYEIFGIKYLLSRAVPTATERIVALKCAGFKSFPWEQEREHYYYNQMKP